MKYRLAGSRAAAAGTSLAHRSGAAAARPQRRNKTMNGERLVFRTAVNV